MGAPLSGFINRELIYPFWFQGVSDDGIDSLRPRFREVCNWIDAARQQGGKILIHCRVGVSRSATITIAYAMRHLGLSLVDAYLLVRSRRLRSVFSHDHKHLDD